MVLKLNEASKRKGNFFKYAGALKSGATNLEEFKKNIEADRARNTEGISTTHD